MYDILRQRNMPARGRYENMGIISQFTFKTQQANLCHSLIPFLLFNRLIPIY